MQLYKAKRQRGLADASLHEAEAKQLLHQFVDVYPQTTIVIDALDECDAMTRMGLVKALDGLVRGAGRPIKIFISSRLDQDIAERFRGGPNVAISALDNRDDIARFAEAEMASRPEWSGKILDVLRAEIVQTLCKESNGM